MRIVKVNSSHFGKQFCCINCPDGAHPLCEYGIIETDGIKFYCNDGSGSARFIVTHVIESTKEINTKGFIEVTEAEDDNKVLMSIDTIDYVSNNWIVQYARLGNGLGTEVKESYDQIKELIKQAQ